MSNSWSRAAASYRMAGLVAFGACATLCACAVFLLAMRTHPVADDFCRATLFTNVTRGSWSGIFIYTRGLYLHWSGRWAGVALECLLVSTPALVGAYAWVMFLLVAAQFLLLYLAIWELVMDVREALYLSAVIACVYWATMPSPQQGIFWIPGTVESQLPLTLGLLMFALVLSRRPTATKQSTLAAMIAACLLGFVTPAFHELVGGVIVLALSAITATAFLSQSYRRKMWLAVWIASVTGFLVVFLAPGNAIRMATISNRGNYSITIKGSLKEIQWFILPWCLEFKHWVLAVLLWFDPRIAALRKEFPGWSSLRAISGFAFVWISLIMIAIGASIWNLGDQPPGRTMNLIYGMFLIGWIALAFLVVRPHPNFSLPPVNRAATLCAALFLLSALVASSDHTRWGLVDIVKGRGRAMDAQLNRRSALLESAGQNEDVLFPPLSEFSKESLIFWYDVNDDPHNKGLNRCMSDYYRVASVGISETSR